MRIGEVALNSFLRLAEATFERPPNSIAPARFILRMAPPLTIGFGLAGLQPCLGGLNHLAFIPRSSLQYRSFCTTRRRGERKRSKVAITLKGFYGRRELVKNGVSISRIAEKFARDWQSKRGAIGLKLRGAN